MLLLHIEKSVLSLRAHYRRQRTCKLFSLTSPRSTRWGHVLLHCGPQAGRFKGINGEHINYRGATTGQQVSSPVNCAGLCWVLAERHEGAYLNNTRSWCDSLSVWWPSHKDTNEHSLLVHNSQSLIIVTLVQIYRPQSSCYLVY